MTAASDGDDPILAGLDDRQREAAIALRGPVRILAGAGTGKTRTITHRIAHGVATGVYQPQRVMALTFTAKAAAQLRRRIGELGVPGVSARTFHAAALAQLNHFWPDTVGGSAPGVLANKAKVVAQVAQQVGLGLDTARLREVAAEIEWRKVSALTYEQYEGANRPAPAGLSPTAIIEVMRRYEAVKDDLRRLDFEDVLLATAGMLESEPMVAARVHEQYRYFTVDEYQDLSTVQHRLLRLWLGRSRDLCVVGDVAQTIFGFAGASSEHLVGFGSEFPGTVTVELDRSYRSSAPILAAANRLVRTMPAAVQLIPADTDRSAAVAAASTPGAIPVTVTEYASDPAEASGVAQRVGAEIAAGVPAREICVLVRTHAQVPVIEAALRRSGVGVSVRGAERFFDRVEVKEALLLIRGQVASHATATGPALLNAVTDVLASVGWRAAAPEAEGAVRDRWLSLEALRSLAADATGDLRSWVAELGARAEADDDPATESVSIATIHAAKGLEFDAVHVVGLAEGLLPSAHATTEALVAEERRLTYVAVTRARRRLSLSYATRSGSATRSPSRFVAEAGLTAS